MATAGDDTAIGDANRGVVVAVHRKMLPQEVYFLSTEKYAPVLFGIPLILSVNESTTLQDLYKSVWQQVSRLVSPLPPRDSAHNHAADCDDSLRYEYPFTLKLVLRDGSWCSQCQWHRFCRGCALPCSGDDLFVDSPSSHLAIDWDQTALHLRYLSAQEKKFSEDPSVAESLRAASEPITLRKCLEAMTREEDLGEEDKYYCSGCKKHQEARLKLQIWRLPPILIVQLKRFHYLNGKWIKSHKIVDFPSQNLDLAEYLAAVPSTTLKRHRSLKARGKAPPVMMRMKSETIAEASEPSSMGSFASSSNNNDDDHATEIHHVVAGRASDAVLEDVDDDSGEGGSVEQQSEKNAMTNGFGSSGDEEEEAEEVLVEEQVPDNRPPSRDRRRMRQISTSLMSHPIADDNLQDFHEHRLAEGSSPFEVNYNLYSMVCHSGVLAGGHYVSYGKMGNQKWYCQNDSACKEIPAEQIDKSSAYLLFYEREDLSAGSYMPRVPGGWTPPDTKDLDEELDTDFKKQCVVM